LSTVFINEAIEALPTADTVSIPKDITAIEDVKAKYDALSETDKAKISTELTEKLNACVTAIKGFATLFDARTETLKANTNTGAASATVNAQTDETYGNVFRLDVVAAGHGQADFFPNVNFSGYERVFFYIYNPGVEGVNLVWYTGSWASEAGNWTPLAANAWTKIEVGTYYSENNAFYLIDKLAGGATYKGWLITSFYGANGEASAPDVETPDIPDEPEQKPSVWNGWTKTTVSANPFSGDNANQSTGTDAAYGDYIQVSDTSGSVYFYTPWITDRTDYEKLGVYVYNCGTSDVSGYYNDWSTGSYNVNFTLKAGEWTLITFTDHYITCGNNYLYINGTFRFSAVYGYQAATAEE
jgi:hypothetical protein